MHRLLILTLLILLGGTSAMTDPIHAQPEAAGESATADTAPTLPPPKRIVICLDGTWASPAKESEREDKDDKVFKPTNVLKTCRAVKNLDDVIGTLTLTAKPTDGETVSIGGKTYTFQDELTDGDGHVAISQAADGAAQKTLENLLFAIDLRPHRNRYSDSMTRHPQVVGRAVPGDRFSLEVVARPNALEGPVELAETLLHGGWSDDGTLVEETLRRGFDPAKGIPQIAYYDIGVGALRRFPGFWNAVLQRVDKYVGGARGAGFEGNVEDAYLFLCLNYQPGDELYLFGFSRGAATARGLAQFIDWMGGILPARDAYWAPRYFDGFLAGADFDSFHAELTAERTINRPQAASIRFLGVWDTVLSLGGDRDERFLRDTPPAAVEHARQALAIDEKRRDFKPREWEAPAHDGQTLEQRWFAGVHTNIGGGYVDDGLANLALEWMMREAVEVGLGLDHEFLENYSGYPFDQLYTSYKGFYKLLRRKRVRAVRIDPAAGMTIDGSVFDRLVGPVAGNHPKYTRYRPKNLLQLLASVGDLDAFMAQIPDLGDDFTIERLRDVLSGNP